MNLVIVGLPDKCTNDLAQKRYDDNKVSNICAKLGIPESAVVSTFREGKAKGKRVLKVFFPGPASDGAESFLKGATWALREDPEMAGVDFPPFVRPDMTLREREADRKLRDELRERRRNGEENLTIRGGHIIAKGSGN